MSVTASIAKQSVGLMQTSLNTFARKNRLLPKQKVWSQRQNLNSHVRD